MFMHLCEGESEAASLLFHPVEHSFRKLHQGILVLALPIPGKSFTGLSGVLLGQASRLFEAPGLTNKSVQIYCQVCPVLKVSCQIGGFAINLKASSTSPSASNLRAIKVFR